jgi:hypothetical protein
MSKFAESKDVGEAFGRAMGIDQPCFTKVETWWDVKYGVYRYRLEGIMTREQFERMTCRFPRVEDSC